MSVLALFQLKNTKTGQLSKEKFADKMEAKKARRALNPTSEDGKETLVWVITTGPDHRSYQ